MFFRLMSRAHRAVRAAGTLENDTVSTAGHDLRRRRTRATEAMGPGLREVSEAETGGVSAPRGGALGPSFAAYGDSAGTRATWSRYSDKPKRIGSGWRGRITTADLERDPDYFTRHGTAADGLAAAVAGAADYHRPVMTRSVLTEDEESKRRNDPDWFVRTDNGSVAHEISGGRDAREARIRHTLAITTGRGRTGTGNWGRPASEAKFLFGAQPGAFSYPEPAIIPHGPGQDADLHPVTAPLLRTLEPLHELAHQRRYSAHVGSANAGESGVSEADADSALSEIPMSPIVGGTDEWEDHVEPSFRALRLSSSAPTSSGMLKERCEEKETNRTLSLPLFSHLRSFVDSCVRMKTHSMRGSRLVPDARVAKAGGGGGRRDEGMRVFAEDADAEDEDADLLKEAERMLLGSAAAEDRSPYLRRTVDDRRPTSRAARVSVPAHVRPDVRADDARLRSVTDPALHRIPTASDVYAHPEVYGGNVMVYGMPHERAVPPGTLPEDEEDPTLDPFVTRMARVPKTSALHTERLRAAISSDGRGSRARVASMAPHTDAMGFRFTHKSQIDLSKPRFYPARAPDDKHLFEQAMAHAPDFTADLADRVTTGAMDEIPEPTNLRYEEYRALAKELPHRDPYARPRTGKSVQNPKRMAHAPKWHTDRLAVHGLAPRSKARSGGLLRTGEGGGEF